MVSLPSRGELSERFKELVLKTSDSERNLGFESLTLRQKRRLQKQSSFYYTLCNIGNLRRFNPKTPLLSFVVFQFSFRQNHLTSYFLYYTIDSNKKFCYIQKIIS